MSEILAFYRRYKERITWCLAGAVIVLCAYFSYQALIGVIALLFAPSAVSQTKEIQKRRREAIKDVQAQSAKADAQAAEIKQAEEQAKTDAGRDAAKQVDDFLDGDWK